jgi:serine/threonine-protein kinase
MTEPSSVTEERVCSLGTGGMGRVDLVARRSGTFTRLVAVKRIRSELAEDPSMRTMFLEEARLAGLIHHPNVVAVSEVREDAEGPYLVMDFVEGVSASKLVQFARSKGEPLPLQVVLRIAIDIAHGLHAAHEVRSPGGEPLDLVHRDVTPGNILVGFDGIARLGDFGVARAIDRDAKTRTGVLKGKLGYLSPEQLQFDEPTRRSDLFALGIVLYELLAAERLYPSDNTGAKRILREPPPDVRNRRADVPADVAELVLRMLSKSPSARPETAAEVARTLERALADLVLREGTIAVAPFVTEHFASERDALRERIRTAKTERAVAPARSKRRWIVAGAALVLVAATIAVALAWNFDPEPEQPAARPVPIQPSAAEPLAPPPSVEPNDAPDEPPRAEAPAEQPRVAPVERPRRRVTRMVARMDAPMEAGDPLIW